MNRRLGGKRAKGSVYMSRSQPSQFLHKRYCGGVSMQNDRIIHPERKVATGAYSDGVLCDGWLYISGQGAVDLNTGEIIAESIEEQVRVTMKNIGKILVAAGCTFDDLVKCTCH